MGRINNKIKLYERYFKADKEKAMYPIQDIDWWEMRMSPKRAAVEQVQYLKYTFAEQ